MRGDVLMSCGTVFPLMTEGSVPLRGQQSLKNIREQTKRYFGCGVPTLESFPGQMDISHMESPTCGLCQSSENLRRLTQKSHEGGTLRRVSGGTSVPQG